MKVSHQTIYTGQQRSGGEQGIQDLQGKRQDRAIKVWSRAWKCEAAAPPSPTPTPLTSSLSTKNCSAVIRPSSCRSSTRIWAASYHIPLLLSPLTSSLSTKNCSAVIRPSSCRSSTRIWAASYHIPLLLSPLTSSLSTKNCSAVICPSSCNSSTRIWAASSALRPIILACMQ